MKMFRIYISITLNQMLRSTFYQKFYNLNSLFLAKSNLQEVSCSNRQLPFNVSSFSIQNFALSVLTVIYDNHVSHIE